MAKKRPYARKRFGQHFLKDKSILQTIVYNASVTEEDEVLEIGPGRGDLTVPLLETGANLTVIEIDRDLASDLKVKFSSNEKFKLIEGDALKMDWNDLFSSIKKPIKMVANLPYNISTPLFFKFLKHRDLFESITVMVQKEVADRLHYQPDDKVSKDYGILTVASANFFQSRMVCKVPPSAFNPPPKVDSAIIQLLPVETEPFDEDGFLEFVRLLFQQRRKRLLPRIAELFPKIFSHLNETDKEKLKDYRPDHLSPKGYVRMFKGLPL